MNLDEEFDKNWKSVSSSDNALDDLKDQKIWIKIENKIQKKKSINKLYLIVAVLLPFFALVIIFNSINLTLPIGQTYIYETSSIGKSYVLPDGSKVELQAYSKLILDKNFAKTNRKISFKGQGRFDVFKDKNRPFVINAGEFDVQVLGTQFFLDQKSSEKKVELYEGKVKITHGKTITYLLPKEIWTNNAERNDYHYYHTDKQKQFSFDHTAYSDAIKKLENTYNINISYPSQFKNKKVSGVFAGNLDEVLSVISFPFNLKPIKINDREIILK